MYKNAADAQENKGGYKMTYLYEELRKFVDLQKLYVMNLL